MSKYESIKLDPYGVVIDTDPHDVGLESYTGSLNMRFKDGAAEKMLGETESFVTTGQPTHLLFNGNHDNPVWVYAGDGILRATDFNNDKDIEGTALTTGTNWDSALFNGLPVLNNTVDTPRYWGNDFGTPTVTADLPAFPANTTCQAIRPFRSFLIALNTAVSSVEQGNRLIWSDSSDAGALPASWDIADPTTLAGDAYLTDDKGEIIDGAQLRDMFVVYKTHSTYLMRLIGGTSVMRLDKVQVNSGLLAKNCITEFKGQHFVVSDGDIILFDGQNVQSIADKRVKSKIFNSIDSVNYINSFTVRDDKLNEILFCYPETGSTYANIAAVWNWADNTWTFRELPDSKHIAPGLTNMVSSGIINSYTNIIDSYTQIYKPFSDNPTVDTLGSAATLAINTIGETNDFDGSAMTSSLEKLTMDLGDSDQVKMIKSVTPRITANAGTVIYIRIGTQLNPEDVISWGSEVAYTVGTDREAHFTQKGRFISIRMRTQNTNTYWKCHGFYFKAALSGKH